ncbi:hypothetical protein ACI3RH_13245 [Lactococcus lactis]
MNKKRVTFVHKGNIMKFTEGGFRNWAYEVAREYPTFTKLEYDEIKNERGSCQQLHHLHKFFLILMLLFSHFQLVNFLFHF